MMMGKTKQPLIEIQNLTWWYPWSKNPILQNFSLCVHPGELWLLRGKSGIGKTTITKLLMRSFTPPKDTMFYNKTDIARMNSDEVQQYRQHIWVVFQDNKLLEWKTVIDNVTYPLHIQWLHRDEIVYRGEMILQQFWLLDKAWTYIPHLSWGEKQKVAIARAMIHQPQFIIADEPTGNLDDTSWENVADELIRLNKLGNTILCITHDSMIVNYISEHIAVRTLSM
jgi:cell division transport system ATP-binding protein